LGTGFGREIPFRTTRVGDGVYVHTPGPGEPGHGRDLQSDVAYAGEQSDAKAAEAKALSEEAPETTDKAIREYLGAIAFTLVLVGGELMAEKDGLRFRAGVALAVAALPVYLSAALWRLVKPRLNVQTLVHLNKGLALWWIRAVFIFALAVILSQFMGRWSFLAPSGPAPTGRVWSRLTDEQRSSLELVLGALPKHDSFQVICLTSDCRGLAEDFMRAAYNAGWAPVLTSGNFYQEPYGITLYVKDINDHSLANAIEKSTGLKIEHVYPSSFPNLESVFIGIRP
jgi:hypothetical protein